MLRWFQGLLAVVVCIVCGVANVTHAQDWTDGNYSLWNSFGTQGSGDGQFQLANGIAADENGLIYISDASLHRIQVFKADGTFVRKWGSQGSGVNQFQNPRGLDIGPDGNLYVCDGGNNRICVYQPDGTFVREWGSSGTGDGQFNNPYRIFVNTEDLIFVVDRGNKRVQVFDLYGGFVRKFNTVDASEALVDPQAVVAKGDGSAFVAQVSGRATYLVKYDVAGNRGIAWNCADKSSFGGLDINAQGQIFSCIFYDAYPPHEYEKTSRCIIKVFKESGTLLFEKSIAPDYPQNLCLTPNGGLVCIFNDWTDNVYGNRYKLFVSQWFNRVFLERNDFEAWVKIKKTQQRSGYPYLDIDFYTNSDGESNDVHVAMCAFLNGTINLANLIPMRTFVDGTETNLGSNVELSSNLKRVTWNMAADWSADTGNVQIQAFAQSGPYYLPFNFLTIPAGGGVSNSFQICRTPVTNADLKQVWLFLVASNDPDVELINGKVYGTSGAYDGQVFCQKVQVGNTGWPNYTPIYEEQTTTAGKNFLWERMSLRDPTTEELTWAKEASSPGIQQWTPRYKVGGRPSKVNEFGLDTGATSGFWAVKQ